MAAPLFIFVYQGATLKIAIGTSSVEPKGLFEIFSKYTIVKNKIKICASST